jgi:hypothetical protein
MYKAIIAIGIAVAACFAAGCGSSGDETAAAAVSKAQFIKQAEAVCNKTLAEGRATRIAWEKANGKIMDPEIAFRRIVGPTLKQEAKELRTLAAPEKDEAKLARLINNLSKGADSYVTEGMKPKSTANFEAFQREAAAYGLGACGA